MKKVSFHTLGCKLNFSESSTLARQFESGGFVRVQGREPSDIYVINSCSVTDHADKKCRNLIRKLLKENPQALMVVTGCYAQLKPHEIGAIEGVDLVVGNNDKGTLFERVATLQGKGKASVHTCEAEELTQFFAAFSAGDRTRAFLKVQDGCDYRCSYCTIPLARGGSRNQPISEVVAEASEIAAKGQREIVITGINTGDFGRTTGEYFIDLLHALDQVQRIDRYRISSIEPNLLTDEIIAFTTVSERFMPHFHIPLQSGCDRILGLMRRRYSTAKFTERIAAVRTAADEVFIGIDVIVGFPGETDDDFEQTYNFLVQLAPAFLHVFPYSVRANTPAADFAGKIAPACAAERARRLGKLSEKLHRDFCARSLNRPCSVLWESSDRGGYMFGFTPNYIKVRAPYRKELINTITELTPTHMEEDGMLTLPLE